METLSLSLIQDDLSVRSKKALIRGILSCAIPSAIIITGYFLFLIMFVAIGFRFGKFYDSDTAPVPIFLLLCLLLFTILVAGIVMMALGKGAWNRVRAIRQDAVNAGVRRPATSFVAHVFGISSFFSGLFLVIFMALYLLLFLLMLLIYGFSIL